MGRTIPRVGRTGPRGKTEFKRLVFLNLCVTPGSAGPTPWHYQGNSGNCRASSWNSRENYFRTIRFNDLLNFILTLMGLLGTRPVACQRHHNRKPWLPGCGGGGTALGAWFGETEDYSRTRLLTSGHVGSFSISCETAAQHMLKTYFNIC